MKKVSLFSRYLLGVIFLVFGLNGFLHFIPMGPMPTGPAGQFMAAVSESHYLAFVFAIEVIAGVLLLVNQYVPLALTLLAAVIANILLFHALMAPTGLPLAALVTLLWLFVAREYRSAFAGILRNHAVV